MTNLCDQLKGQQQSWEQRHKREVRDNILSTNLLEYLVSLRWKF